jgi:hypothetical protein
MLGITWKLDYGKYFQYQYHNERILSNKSRKKAHTKRKDWAYYSKYIGKIRELYVVKDNNPYPTKVVIKVMPSIDGLMFSCSPTLIKNDLSYTIMDNKSRIQHYSKPLERHVSKNDMLRSKSELFCDDCPKKHKVRFADTKPSSKAVKGLDNNDM